MTTQTPDAVREAVAKAMYDATHAGLSNCYAWEDHWEDYQEHNRLRYYKEAQAAIDCLAALDSRAGDAGEAVAWCSPGQLANLTDVDRDGGVYLPIRKTRRGNFTMPLFATPAPAVDAVPAGEVDLPKAARLALMYLETGHIECPQCGHEVPTKDLDAVWQIKDGLAALSHGEGRK